MAPRLRIMRRRSERASVRPRWNSTLTPNGRLPFWHPFRLASGHELRREHVLRIHGNALNPRGQGLGVACESVRQNQIRIGHVLVTATTYSVSSGLIHIRTRTTPES